jgi:hypothetical protein
VLAKATHLVHLNCNTAVEARLLGLRPIQASFLNSDRVRRHMPLYTEVSVSAQSMDDLCRLLEDEALLAARDDADGIFENWIRPSFHSCDGYAARRVAEAVLARTGPRKPNPGATATPLRRLKLAACGVLGSLPIQMLRRSLQPDRRVKAFSTAEVETLVADFSAHLGLPAPPVRRRRSPWTAMPMGAIEVG